MKKTTEKTVITETPETVIANPFEGKTAAELLSILNDTEDRNEHPAIITAIEEAVKAENKVAMNSKLSAMVALADTAPVEFWNEMICNPYAPAVKLVETDDGYELAQKFRRFLFSKVDALYQQTNNGESIANAKNYLRMIAHITDNLYRQTCSDLSDGVEKKCAVVRVAATIDGEKQYRDVDFSKASKSAIKTQIQAYLDTIMPKSEIVLVRSADVNYILKGFENAKDGNVKTGKETVVERLVFDAVKKLRIGEAYTVESQAACHKSASKPVVSERTESQEEKMSKVADRPEAVATLSKPE